MILFAPAMIVCRGGVLLLICTHGSIALASTTTHVALPRDFGKGRIACLKATFRCYVKMEGTKDRTHPFPQLPSYVIIRIHPSPPPLIFTYVKTSEKHRHGQALLAMSVFVFLGQDGVGEIRFVGFCQVRSRQKERPVTNFNTHIAFSERDELWVRQEWLKGVYGRCGQDMEAWTGIQRFDRLDKDRLAWNDV